MLKRFLKPASIQEAKSAAERLKDFLSSRNIGISRSLALESLSIAAGYRDWNTLHGVLMQPEEINADVVTIELAKINRAFCVSPGLEKECIEALRALCGLKGAEREMWVRRAENLLTHVVILHFMISEHEMRPPSLRGIRETMVLTRFCEDLRKLEKESPGTHLLPFYTFLETIPGLKMRHVRGEEDFQDKTLEQWGFMSMQLTKPIAQMIES